MLNPKLKLNEKMFDEKDEKIATRVGYGEALLELGENNKNVVVLTADLAESTRVEAFGKKYPERFFDCGVAEQNMAAVAAGFGVSGKIAFISSYATFSPGKNWETIRTTAVYNHSQVKIAGHHSGIMTGPDGATHQATEDIAITRCWPGMHVLVPCDSIEAKKATLASADIDGPVYLRFSRDKSAVITTADTPFEVGKIQTFWIHEKAMVSIFATGYLLYEALLAARQLESENIFVNVINISTIKPLDKTAILEEIGRTKHVVTVEDHQIEGGMGSALSELFSQNLPVPMEFVGLENVFAESGKISDLVKKYKLDSNGIIDKVKKVVKR